MDSNGLAPSDVDERTVHMVRAACALIIAAEKPVTTGDVASLLRQADFDRTAMLTIASIERIILSLGLRTVGMWEWRRSSPVWHLAINLRLEDEGRTRYACGLLQNDPYGTERSRGAIAPDPACAECRAFAEAHLEVNARAR